MRGKGVHSHRSGDAVARKTWFIFFAGASRPAQVTDTGAFALRDVLPGRYLIQATGALVVGRKLYDFTNGWVSKITAGTLNTQAAFPTAATSTPGAADFAMLRR